jgi:hypothetical protein
MDTVACPFCGEDDFDRVGLSIHLQSGWCEGYPPPKVDAINNLEGDAHEKRIRSSDAGTGQHARRL